MANPRENWGASILDSIRHGVVALLARSVTQSAARWGRWDLSLACLASLLAARTVHGPLGLTRISSVFTEVLRTVLIGALMEAFRASDPSLDMPTMLGTYLLLDGLDIVDLGGSVQYRFAERVADALSAAPDVGFVVATMGQSLQGALAMSPRLQATAAMVSVDLVTQYVARATPSGLEVPTILLLMFLCHPLAELSHSLASVYSYAIYASCDELRRDGLPAWVHGVGGVVAWQVAPEPISQALGQLVGTHFLSQALIESVQGVASTDPVLACLVVAVGLGIILQVSAAGVKKAL